ncbi:MAG: tetratricopeptide repeat protein [Betaproteobacteria bacterium]|nr:tetratricopeptide repeat protein [Betaproteobacteria bacterium]
MKSHTVDYLVPAFEGDRLLAATWVASMETSSSWRRYAFLRESDRRPVAFARTPALRPHVPAGRCARIAASRGPMATPVRAAPMPPAPLRALTSLAAALAAACALAQAPSPPPPADPPPTPLPAEYSDAARKAYVAGLKEARELIAQKRYEAAIERLDGLSRDRPREPQARFLKAVAQTEAGKRDDALATLTALAADFPELPEVHNNLAVLYAAKGNLELAKAELELAIAASPDYAPAVENLGDVYARLAARQYERAAELEKGKGHSPAKLKLVRDALAVN